MSKCNTRVLDGHLEFGATAVFTGDCPAWTILGVAALARASLLVEIRAVAALKT